MQDYPSIERGYIVKGEPIYAFDKMDGSQIRAEWTKKKKFWKFGTRKQLISKSKIRGDKGWGEAVWLVLEKYEKDLHDIFVKERYLKATCFFEFYGKNSFAGRHYDEEHTVTLFDIKANKKGLLPPKEFLKVTNGVDRAKLLYYGNANEPFIETVRNGELEGMTFEGVVCKAQRMKTYGLPIMFKLKNKAWLEKLKGFCKGDTNLFEKLV